MKAEELRVRALELALEAHRNEPLGITALLLIQEAQRIYVYIEKGEEFLPQDANKEQ